jgi:hypothetical protein
MARGDDGDPCGYDCPTGSVVLAYSPGGEEIRIELPKRILGGMALDGFVRALDGFEAVLAGVAPGHWSAPSPCAGWSATDSSAT